MMIGAARRSARLAGTRPAEQEELTAGERARRTDSSTPGGSGHGRPFPDEYVYAEAPRAPLKERVGSLTARETEVLYETGLGGPAGY
ncbi:hypothetical protein [Streptomyces sp. URMC 124]|uniref:hypothetical protein n=1 Tax=Streptomyces sp. URMC 124 TaxID=3423405 RepID=UPI003F19CFE9